MLTKYYGLNTARKKNEYWERIVNDDRKYLNEAIESLKPETAEVIRLYYFEHKSMLDICLIIDKSISIVRNHYNRGMFLIYHYIEERKLSSSVKR